MTVWCVFFVSDETLNWELDKIFHDEYAAQEYASEWNKVHGSDYKVEWWQVT